MNVENVHSSGHSLVSQIATHIVCILSSTVSHPALNSSAGTSSEPVALRLAVWRMARATSERNGGGCCSQYPCSIPFPYLSWYKSSQYPFHLSVICAASVKFSPVIWLDILQTWLELSSHWFNYLGGPKSCTFPMHYVFWTVQDKMKQIQSVLRVSENKD